MRATSQIHVTITNLVTIARAAVPARLVFDGPDVSGDHSDNVMWIGLDDPDATDFTAATGSASWAQLGNNSRDERFVVNAVATSWTGDENRSADGTGDVFKLLRERVFTDIAAVETPLRDDPSAGALLTAGSTLRQIEVQVTRVVPVQNNHGSAVVVQFQFLCWCRI